MTGARAGFSLIEALVVLAISGMALLLIFSVGTRATDTGFRLGRDALGRADRAVEEDSVRALLSGLVLTPRGADPGTFKVRPFRGEAARLEADTVSALSTRCAPGGPVRDLRLEITPEGAGSQLTCRVGDGAPVRLIGSARPLAFSYSEDGLNWGVAWTNAADPFAAQSRPETQTPGEQRLYVRLVSDDGQVEVLALARSGRAELLYARDRERVL